MDRIKDIRHFDSGGMNLDDDARILQPNEHRELYNSIIAVAESDHVSCLQNIKGTVNIFELPINAGFYFTEYRYTFNLIGTAFSGDRSGFDVLTPTGTYSYGFDSGEGVTMQSIFDSLVLASAVTPTEFTITMIDGHMVITSYVPLTISTSAYFTSAEMTVTQTTITGQGSDGVRAIGSCEDIKENALIFFLCDTVYGTRHSIIRVYVSDYRCEWILKAEPLLNFKADHLITSSNRIGDLLYWTDGYFNSFLNSDFNPPRKINIPKAIKYTQAYSNRWAFIKAMQPSGIGLAPATSYIGQGTCPYSVGDKIVAWSLDGINHRKEVTGYSIVAKVDNSGPLFVVETDRPWFDVTFSVTSLDCPGYCMPYEPYMYFGIDWQVLDRIKWQPSLPPTPEYQSNTGINANYLNNDLFQFMFRYIMDDNEKSVFSPMSDIDIPNKPESVFGTTDQYLYYKNLLRVRYYTGSVEVKAIEIAVRKGNIGSWKIIRRENKYDQDGNVLVPDNIYYFYDFYNNEIGIGIDQEDANRIQDFVPLVSGRQDIIENNRICDVDYVEGFDNTDMDVSLTSKQVETTIGGVKSSITTYEPRRWWEGSPDFFFKKYHAGRVNLLSVVNGNTFWETGYSYMILISFSPGYYNNPENLPDYTTSFRQWEGNAINAIAYSEASPGISFKMFIDDICSQLRIGSAFGNVIAYNNYGYKPYLNQRLWDIDKGGSTVPALTDDELGFLIEYCGGKGDDGTDETGNWTSCVNCKYGVFKAIKFKGSLIQQSFKSGAWHEFGWVYKDRAGRRSMVNTTSSSKLYIKSIVDYLVQHQIYKNEIEWEINNIPPPEAVYLQPVYGKNTSIEFSLFASIKSITNTSNSVANINTTSICINEYIQETRELLQKFNVSMYQWEKGDRLRFVYTQGVDYVYETLCPYDVEILGIYYPDGDIGYGSDTATGVNKDFIRDLSGNKQRNTGKAFLTVPQLDFNRYYIAADKTIVEIYRPKKNNENIIYYDYGNPLPILNPHTPNRSHTGTAHNQIIVNGVSVSPAKGLFSKGDVYIGLRLMHNLFPVERFNFSDFFDSECFGIGFPNIADPNVRHQEFISNIRYGGLYIENTQINDLSKFKGADYIVLPEKFGPINFIKEVGFTLKVIQKYKPSSIYVGRQGLTQADIKRGEVLYASSNTLGTVTTSESTYGTEHPESCIKHEGNIYYYDINSGCIVRDSGNGIRAISQQEDGDQKTPYKIKTLMQTKSRLFQTHDVNVFGTYDGRYDIVYFSFVDHTNPDESFTIGFHEPSNKWVSFYSFIPEFIGSLKMSTMSWKDGALWLHDVGTRMNFYGVQYKQTVKTVSNAQPLSKKRFLSLTENSNKVWHLGNQGDVYIPPDETYKRGQTSLVKAGAFSDLEGTIYAAFGKNMTTHNAYPSNDDYLNGDSMRGNYIELTLNNESTDEVNLFAIEVDSIISKP